MPLEKKHGPSIRTVVEIMVIVLLLFGSISAEGVLLGNSTSGGSNRVEIEDAQYIEISDIHISYSQFTAESVNLTIKNFDTKQQTVNVSFTFVNGSDVLFSKSKREIHIDGSSKYKITFDTSVSIFKIERYQILIRDYVEQS